jgi:hypothetical protein
VSSPAPCCAAKTNMRRATGDADGLGEVRKKELVKSGLQLGVGSKDDIMVIEDKYGLSEPTIAYA